MIGIYRTVHRAPRKAASLLTQPWSAAVVAAVLLAKTPAAAAAWHEASTEHFVLYANEKPAQLTRKARRLERLHVAFVRLFGIPDRRPSPSNRLTVFLLDDNQAVNLYFDHPTRAVDGFFVGVAGGSAAFVGGGRVGDTKQVRAERVLAHEYAHFLMWRKQGAALPPWYSEGHAEFAATVAFDAQDRLSIGAPSERHRARVQAGTRLDVGTVLETRAIDEIPPARVGGFYGTSFALYHYLYFQPDGARLLENYYLALAGGAPLAAAADDAFGGLGALASSLDDYLVGDDLPSRTLPETWFEAGKIEVRKLERGEAKTLPWRMWLMRGVTPQKAKALLPGLEPLVERYAQSDAAVATLADLHYAARNDVLAVSTAQRVIDRTPRHLAANVVKMKAQHRAVGKASDRPAAWKLALRQIQKVNRLEPEHPLPLKFYYAGQRGMHLMHGGPAPDGRAFAGMRRALELAPYDDELRRWVGAALMQAGRLEEARLTLLPLTTHVHQSAQRDGVLKAIEKIDRALAAEERESAP